MMNYATILKQHNLKATPQRLAILEEIEYHGHISIDKLYEKIKERFRSISLATIYKNINAMTQSFLLFEVKLPSEKSVYEISKEQHSHLLCKECGVVTDIDLQINSFEEQIQEQYHFTIKQTDVVFSGTCQKCQ